MQELIIFIFFLILLSSVAYWYVNMRNPSMAPPGITSTMLKPAPQPVTI